jgi:hypothetical protein
MPLLRGAAALLFLGGLVYAMLSGNWGNGAIAFSLGAVVLGLDRLGVAQSRPDRAIGGGTCAVRRVNHNVHRTQDGARRNIGWFSAWYARCAINLRESTTPEAGFSRILAF